MRKAKYVYQPDYAVHPGEILGEHLEALQMSQAELARRCNRSSKLISEIISGKAPIEPATAVHLEKAHGYWTPGSGSELRQITGFTCNGRKKRKRRRINKPGQRAFPSAS